MLTELKQGSKVVGVKQTKRAVNDGKAARVFLAEDADPRVTAPVEALCAEKQIPVERVPQMKELGSACGIAVPARWPRCCTDFSETNNFHPFR